MRLFRVFGTALPFLAVTLTPLLALTQPSSALASSSAVCTYNGESYGANATRPFSGDQVIKLGDATLASPSGSSSNSNGGFDSAVGLVGAISDQETASSTTTQVQLTSSSNVGVTEIEYSPLPLIYFRTLTVTDTVTALTDFASGTVSGSASMPGIIVGTTSESSTPAANTTISAANVSVTLNEEVGAVGKSGADLTVNGLVLSAPLAGLEIELGHTYSSANCFPNSNGPSCSFVSNDNPTGLDSNGHAIIYVSCVDATNGIESITTTSSNNVSVSVPSAPVGYTGTIVSSFTDTNNGPGAHFTLTATDNSAAHNQTVIDPSFVPVVRHYLRFNWHFLREWLRHWR